MYIDASYQFTEERGKITREWYQTAQSIDVSELRYQMLDQRLNLDLHLGIYKDVEFHFRLPIVFQQDRTWQFAAGTDATNSTIYQNCLQRRTATSRSRRRARRQPRARAPSRTSCSSSTPTTAPRATAAASPT